MKKIAFLSQIKEFFVKICKTNKKLLFLAVALILILIVAVISSFSNSSEIKNKSLNSSETLTINNYADSLELKIENLLSSMSSIKQVEVFVMLESSPITNYLTETEKTKNTTGENISETEKEVVVFEKDGSLVSPVTVSVTMPKVVGVLIFLNKIDSSTKLSISNAISVVLNIDESRISILQDR